MKLKYWVITDTHFGHENIKEYCDRPDGFEELIFSNLYVIKDEDVIIHLGDFSFYNKHYWNTRFASLNKAKKWLVLGNHDRDTSHFYLSSGWNFVGQEIKLKIHGKKILFSHKPVTIHDDFDLNIHGHFHNNPNAPFISKKHKLVVLEDNYSPVPLSSLLLP